MMHHTMTQSQAQSEPKKCKCGYSVGHSAVRKSPAYSVFGWCMLLWGVSVTPKHLEYKCLRCGDVLARITDAAELEAKVNH